MEKVYYGKSGSGLAVLCTSGLDLDRSPEVVITPCEATKPHPREVPARLAVQPEKTPNAASKAPRSTLGAPSAAHFALRALIGS